VENLTNEATTPEHLITILDLGHLDNVGVCLDLGHANITVGIPEAIAVLGPRVVSLHVHDNHGMKDEHLWPGDGTVDWPATTKLLSELPKPPAAVLEIHYTLGDTSADIPAKIQAGFDKLG
jgi:sugar phosphate isomerase/epimerase